MLVKMAEFLTLKSSWPWRWPWMGLYCIPSFISVRSAGPRHYLGLLTSGLLAEPFAVFGFNMMGGATSLPWH